MLRSVVVIKLIYQPPHPSSIRVWVVMQYAGTGKEMHKAKTLHYSWGWGWHYVALQLVQNLALQLGLGQR